VQKMLDILHIFCYHVFMMNAIEHAVMPVKQDAIAFAAEEAARTIENAKISLAAVDGDRNKVAPYPKGDFRDYHEKLAKYNLYCRLTSANPGQGHRCMNDPLWVTMDPEECERYIQEQKDDAAIEYDAFVAKLVKKIGKVEGATLQGNHVWGFSILTVSKADGTVEKWKTTQIWNRSKHGKEFPQWPSRKMR